MRHAATRSLLDRDDVIIVASVSCIYGLGSPEAYHDMLLYVEKDAALSREDAVKKLVEIHYERGDIDFYRGRFRVGGMSWISILFMKRNGPCGSVFSEMKWNPFRRSIP